MDFDQMMAELRTEYVASIPKKIADIELHLKENTTEKLRDDFHKLKGTGKTYGIPEVSELGFVVEKICMIKPELINVVIPMSTLVLLAIYKERLENKIYDVNKDVNFQKISSLL
jgi:hypothetical protein